MFKIFIRSHILKYIEDFVLTKHSIKLKYIEFNHYFLR